MTQQTRRFDRIIKVCVTPAIVDVSYGYINHLRPDSGVWVGRANPHVMQQIVSSRESPNR